MADHRDSDSVDEQFLRSMWPALVRLGRLLTGSTELAEDLAQEAIVGLVRHPSAESPKAYLYRSMVNLSINVARRAARERARLHLVDFTADHVPAPETDELWPLVLKLPARQRAVLVLRYYDDLSEIEIARVLDCRPGTVKSLASRGLAQLRKELRP